MKTNTRTAHCRYCNTALPRGTGTHFTALPLIPAYTPTGQTLPHDDHNLHPSTGPRFVCPECTRLITALACLEQRATPIRQYLTNAIPQYATIIHHYTSPFNNGLAVLAVTNALNALCAFPPSTFTLQPFPHLRAARLTALTTLRQSFQYIPFCPQLLPPLLP